MRSTPSLLLVVALVSTTAAHAGADDRAACLEASEQGQRLRNANKLVEASEQLRACARRECPAVVQSDCATWLGEVQRDMPTVVVTARDAAGVDRIDVRVSVDGVPFATQLDGGARPVNPGAHVFHVELADGTSVDQRVVVREGEKNQPIAATLGTPAPGPAATSPALLPAPPPPPLPPPPRGEAGTARAPGGSSQRTLGLALGGVGLVGIAAGAVAGLVAIGAKNQQLGTCASSTNCPHHDAALSDHGTATTSATTSTVAFAAGAASLAAGLVLYLTAPSGAVVQVSPQIGAGHAGVGVAGSF